MWECADLIWFEWYFNRNELVSDRAAVKINYGPWNAMRTTRWSIQTWQLWQLYVKSFTFCSDELDEILTDPQRSDRLLSACWIFQASFQRRPSILTKVPIIKFRVYPVPLFERISGRKTPETVNSPSSKVAGVGSWMICSVAMMMLNKKARRCGDIRGVFPVETWGLWP